MAERKAVTAATRSRYQLASKKEKGKILAEFIELTGYHRIYAPSVLRTIEREIVRDQLRRAESKSDAVKSRKVYHQQVLVKLRQIWLILDSICGKRMVAIMPEVSRRLEYFGALRIESEVRAKLLRITAATIDRLFCGVESAYSGVDRRLPKQDYSNFTTNHDSASSLRIATQL